MWISHLSQRSSSWSYDRCIPKLNVWCTWKLLKPTENGWLLLSTSSYFHLEGWKWTQIGQTEKKTEATHRAISSLWLQRLHSAASVKNLSEHKNSYIPQKLKETQDCQFAVLKGKKQMKYHMNRQTDGLCETVAAHRNSFPFASSFVYSLLSSLNLQNPAGTDLIWLVITIQSHL